MKRKFLLSLIITSFSLLFAEQYKISDYSFDITGAGFQFLGKTRESAIISNYPIDTKAIFETKEDFETYISNYKRQLDNSRAFEEIEITYESDLSKDNSVINHYILKFTIKDSHHLVIFPIPKYDSNSGVTLKIKAKDTNFLGTLKTLNFDLNTNYYDEQFTVGINFSYDYPFKAGPFDSLLINDYSLDFIIGKRFPEFSTKTGIELSYPVKNFAYVFDFFQYIYKDYDYELFDDDLYFKEEAEFSIPFKLYRFKNFSNLIYKPFINFSFNWDFNGIELSNNDLSSPIVTLGHSISNENINWEGSFRKGYSLNLDNSYIYNIQRKDFYSTITYEMLFFNNFKAYEDREYFDRFGFYTRIKAFTTLEIPSNKFSYGQEINDYLRGIREDTYYGTSKSVPTALLLNIDLPHHAFSTNFKHDLINFDLLITAFFDAALIYNRDTGKLFNLRDGQYCAGVEFLVFPKNWSSYTIRASAGFDLKSVLDSTRIIKGLLHNYEVYIGLGTAY